MKKNPSPDTNTTTTTTQSGYSKKTKENVENAHILRRSTGTQTTMGARLLLQVKLKLSSELGIPSMDDHHQQHSKRNKRRIRIYFFWFFFWPARVPPPPPPLSSSPPPDRLFLLSLLHCKTKTSTRAREEGTTTRSRAKQSKAKERGKEAKNNSAVQCSAATVLCKERRKFTNPFLNWDTLIRISKRGLARERARGRE